MERQRGWENVSEADAKRAYHSPIRAARAARTRSTIIEAAADLFEELGFTGTTVRAIAERAGVSPESVNGVGQKASLLVEAFQVRYLGEGGWQSIWETEMAREIVANGDADAGLEAAVEFLVTAHARSAALWTVVCEAARVEPVVAAAVTDIVSGKFASFQATVSWLAELGVVDVPSDPGSLVTAGATVNVVMSSDTYLLLRNDWGFTDDDYRQWVREAIRGVGAWPHEGMGTGRAPA